jgi:outer membrane receptor protein involved in Fe transport
LVSGYVRDWEMDALSKILYTRNQVQEKQTNLETFEINKWIHGMGNINLRHHFQEEEILDFNLDYLNYYNKNPSIYKVEHLDAFGQPTYNENIDVKKVTPIDILVGAIDYTNQFTPAFKLEAGVKGTMTFFQNDVGVSYFNGGSWSNDPELTGKYTMNESIGAAFLSLSLKLGTGTSMAGGLRYEYLNSVLDSEQEKGIIDLNYGRVFPTFYLSQKLNQSNTLQFSYSKRIDRPTFNELAPFIIFVTPETYISGNEKLLPAFSNILKMDYQVKSVIFTVSHTATTDAIARFQPKMSEDNTKQYYISRNLDKSTTLSVVLAFPITITEWWKMQNNLNWLKQNVTTEYESLALDITQAYYQINTNQSFTFTKSLSGEISGFYRSKFLTGVGIAKPLARVDMGAQWKVSENSRFNLNVSDAFKTSIFRGVSDIPELNIYSRWELDFEPRVYRLTFTHNFGNAALKVRKRNSASEEEKSRITQ